MFFVLLRVAHDQVLHVYAELTNASVSVTETLSNQAAGLKWCNCFRINPRIIAGSAPLGVLPGGVLGYRYNLASCARSSMDRIRVSETLDTGSIPVGRTKLPGFSGQIYANEKGCCDTLNCTDRRQICGRRFRVRTQPYDLPKRANRALMPSLNCSMEIFSGSGSGEAPRPAKFWLSVSRSA